MMVISQLKTIFDLKAPAGGWKDSMFGQLSQTLARAGEIHWIPFALALIVILVATLAVMMIPKGPSPLFGVIVAILAAAAFGWHEKQVGRLPLEVPPFAGFVWYPSDVWKVLPEAFGLAFVTSVNLLVTSRIVDHFRGRHHHFDKADADAELGVYGIANIVCGMFGAPMSVGIPARSLANVQCGGTTRMSNILHGVILLGFLTVGAKLIAQIPLAALAGVTAWMGFRLLDWSTWRRLHKMRRVDAAAFLSTALAALIVNAVAALAIGWSLYGFRAAYWHFARQTRYIKAAAATEPK
jgi:SulP family sulfate permease